MYLRSLLWLQGDAKILDLSCGWGAILKLLRDEGHSGELMGLTVSKEQLVYAQTLGLDMSLKNFITTPFERHPFDMSFSVGALEHVCSKEIKAAIRRFFNFLLILTAK